MLVNKLVVDIAKYAAMFSFIFFILRGPFIDDHVHAVHVLEICE